MSPGRELARELVVAPGRQLAREQAAAWGAKEEDKEGLASERGSKEGGNWAGARRIDKSPT